MPIAPYGTPSTMEIPDAVEPYLEHFDAVLLESHGALTWSTDLLAAYIKMESVEFYAELSCAFCSTTSISFTASFKDMISFTMASPTRFFTIF